MEKPSNSMEKHWKIMEDHGKSWKIMENMGNIGKQWNSHEHYITFMKPLGDKVSCQKLRS
jgi:hypothetical protein